MDLRTELGIGRKLIRRGRAEMRIVYRVILLTLKIWMNLKESESGDIMRKFASLVCLVLCVGVARQTIACTISEDLVESVPLNYPGIPNEYRIKIVDMVLNARKWPGVEIQAQIIANAYVGEDNPKMLAESRGAMLKDFLVKLGVKQEYVYVDTHIVRSPYDKDSTGRGGYSQLGVSLLPLCKGGCERLCDDLRIIPNSKGIK